MSWNRLYTGTYKNAETHLTTNLSLDVECTVNIYDTESGEADDPSEIIDLVMDGFPLICEVVDSEERKFNVFRSKRYQISIHSSDSIGIETFIEGGDNRYYVEIIIGGIIKFTGYLSISDISEDFLPDPNVIVLIATDGLGFLEDEDLTDLDGDIPQNENNILSYLRWALAKSGQSLNVNAVFNIRERFARPIANDAQVPITIAALFFAPGSGNHVRVITADAGWFYVGQTFTVTGADVNVGPFTVTSMVAFDADNMDIFVTETLVAFGSAAATFTDTSPEGHFFLHEFLDAKTFEGSDPGAMIDCKEVVRRILGYEAFITHYNGEWWIIRVDEIQYGSSYYITKFDPDGNVISRTMLDKEKLIGIASEHSWMDEDCQLTAERALKLLELLYKYEYPIELVCNIDFDRGTGPDSTNAPSETIDYVLECWEFLSEGLIAGVDLDSPPEAGSVGVLRKLFEFDYEKDRYLATITAGGFRHYFKSTGIEMNDLDKITIGFQFRFSIDLSNTIIDVAHVRLVGDDGFVYDWDLNAAGVSSWVQKTATNPVFDTVWMANISGIDTRDWVSVSATSEPIPVSGTLYIRLLNSRASPVQMDFSALIVNYIPLINGSYGKYTGQKHIVSQAANTKATLKEQAYISDGPNKNVKGALLKLVGGIYVLTVRFYNGAVLPAGIVTEDQAKPYGEGQVFDVWNQYNRTMRKFEGKVDRLESDADIPDVIHRYVMTDGNANTGQSTYMCLHFTQDLNLCEMEGFFHEVHDPVKPKVYTGHDFKYTTSTDE